MTQCASWDEFIQALRITKSKRYARRIYRGQANTKWKLDSTWERYLDRLRTDPLVRHEFGLDAYKELRDIELSYFENLTAAMPEMPNQALNEIEDKWSFGRHYGLNTPLLDWTSSPFVAAFWAFVSRVISENPSIEEYTPTIEVKTSDQPVAVWELSCPKELLKKDEFILVDNIRYELHRQRAQSGLFTYVKHDEHTDIESYLKSEGIGEFLERYEIPCSSEHDASIALSDLERMNIHFGTVFPDAYGAARQVKVRIPWARFKFFASAEEPSWDSPKPTED